MLCTTLAGNTCDVLTITSPADSGDAIQRRKGVVITGAWPVGFRGPGFGRPGSGVGFGVRGFGVRGFGVGFNGAAGIFQQAGCMPQGDNN